ncbi:interleukin-1 receptor-associated kinase 1-binding protein 1 homolog [Styela clava]|uniref:interleukin-1 receptor-associated kinase 1-binding protein 1-like n=1 Tax=Styela clava TaxID=7725 RepID=UPI00193A5485|nr:interleukin-1 receptor-associated kinase 1-binding protein 1-like [Styela clava]XP_039265747.1 interleukin-1 receptor-associated kinase 1-binding protein 1-like [Styela clava]
MCDRNILEPSHIFASLKPDKNLQDKEHVDCRRAPKREVQVTGSAELMVAPSICVLTVVIRSEKSASDEAKNSVLRRLEYVQQTFKNHGVQDGDMIVVKNLSRNAARCLYVMEAQVDVTFRNSVHKCMQLHNLFVEKLDDTVKVLRPQLMHDKQKLEGIRKQACLTALANARQKAIEVCRMLGQTIGRPICVKEDFCDETLGSNSNCQTNEEDHVLLGNPTSIDLQQRVKANTITIKAQVSATFELKLPIKHRK